ncbi:MAG: IS66 family transposase [Bdellovibrionales bacterium]|nr:IS66 family transposase [Bdellovibrionales bacterium]
MQEKSPEILRALSLQLSAEVERLRGVINEIEAEKAQRAQTQLNIEEQVKILKRKLFGRKSESRNKSDERKTQEDAHLFSQAAFPLPDEEKDQKEKRQSLPGVQIVHELSLIDLKNESELRGIENPSGDQWEEMRGSFDKLTTIQIIERSYERQEHLKKKYRLKDEFNPDRDEKDVIVTAPGPAALLPGMNYDTDFVASVVADKFISHMPLDRQRKEMESLGLAGMRTSTLSRHCALSAASFEEMAERIKSELLGTGGSVALHLDETPWKIQNKDERDGYMWVISNRLGSYYFFKPTRAGEVIKEALTGYAGRVLTDGYAGYNILEEAGIEQAFCWSHGRRNFLPVEEGDPGVKEILDNIDHLFAIEREAKTFDELRELRNEKSRLIIAEIHRQLLGEYPKSRPKGQKRKAIEFLMKRWKGFTLFLDDIRIPLSNNEAERTIRPATIGRKNYHGSGNHTGAETAATHFTIVESCKKNDLDPRQFIQMSLRRIAAGLPVMTPLEYAKHLRAAPIP